MMFLAKKKKKKNRNNIIKDELLVNIINNNSIIYAIHFQSEEKICSSLTHFIFKLTNESTSR